MSSDRFDVELTEAALKDLRRMRAQIERVTRALAGLEHDPYRGHSLTGNLGGARSLEFSLPGGAYRAAYVVLEAERVCVVFQVGPHEGFYAKAARRYAALRKSGRV